MPQGDGLSWAEPRWYSSPSCLPQWLNEEKIVQRLIEQIHPSRDDNVSVGKGPLCGGWWWWRRRVCVLQSLPSMLSHPRGCSKPTSAHCLAPRQPWAQSAAVPGVVFSGVSYH